MKSVALGQNFLQSPRVAQILVRYADGPEGAVCVDLGAGDGLITSVAITRGGPVEAVELDPRLAARLRRKFAAVPAVRVVEGDLLTVELPRSDFVIAANPPFTTSTKLVRRWMLAKQFLSGAMPYLEISVGLDIPGSAFSPAPMTPTTILVTRRLPSPAVAWNQRHAYGHFVNYLFERGRLTVGEALGPLRVPGMAKAVSAMEVRRLPLSTAIELFEIAAESTETTRSIRIFNDRLPPRRRLDVIS